MRRLAAERTMSASQAQVWRVLIDLDEWPRWGPTITAAELHDADELAEGTTGRVTVVGGIALSFVITEYTEGRSWAWSVAGVPATDHRVDAIGDRCRARIGVPILVAPYLVVCRTALRRIERLANATT
jgi:uncharacterized protein YndB with AHSA1/START domain